MLKVAIVGCGKIADSHLEQLGRIPNCRVVAACDRETLMAVQLAERFKIAQHFSDVKEMLRVAAPDVVHVTTPPESHFPIAKICLEAGSHVYVEKPFTLDTVEAQALVDLAEKQGRKITVGHDLQFSQAARRMRKLIDEGYLGGKPVHMESYYCYDLSDAKYARALLANKQHWVRRLPGQLLHNVISHGIARIAEFLTTDSPQVIVCGYSSPMLASMGENELTDELRVIINEENRTTAYFTFSSQMRPSLNAFRVYGPRNGLVLDEDQQSVIPIRGHRYKSYAEKFIPPVYFARQHLSNLAANVRLFLRNDFHMKAGMKCLIESFYRSISEGSAVPIPYHQILRTSRIMDSIFTQLNSRNVARNASEPTAKGIDAHRSSNGHTSVKLNLEAQPSRLS
jgi:predicted dehydrogenase